MSTDPGDTAAAESKPAEPPATRPRRVHELIEHWAEHAPGTLALADPTCSVAYAQLRTLLEHAAEALRARGLRPGDRVLIVGENSVAALVLLLAAQRLDAWPALVNARLAEAELAAILARVEPRLLLFVTGQSNAAERHAQHLRTSAFDALPFEERVRVDAAPRECVAEPVHRDAERQVGLLIFTSGTTGTAKAVMHSHNGLLILGQTLAASRQTRCGDTYTGATPMAHIMGTANLMNALWSGAGLRLLPRLDPGPLLAAIADGHMTHLSFVPTAYLRLLEYAEAHAIDLRGHRLRYLSSGGAPLEPALKARVEALFGVPLVNAFGMTECAPGTRARPDRASPPGSIGWPEKGVTARIVSDEGMELGEGEIGELWLHAPARMMGYYRDEAQTRAVFRPDGWLATGDLARWLAEGELQIVGRSKEMIIRSGFNVYPAEVEQALNTLPGVRLSAVVGRREQDGNERIVAYVQPAEGTQPEPRQMREALRTQLAPYKIPQEIVLVEQLPLGPTGKIRKHLLS